MFFSNLLKLRFGVNDLELQLLERSIIGLEMRLDNLENFAKPLCRLAESFVRADPSTSCLACFHQRHVSDDFICSGVLQAVPWPWTSLVTAGGPSLVFSGSPTFHQRSVSIGGLRVFHGVRSLLLFDALIDVDRAAVVPDPPG